jgi:hypothetical protein
MLFVIIVLSTCAAWLFPQPLEFRCFAGNIYVLREAIMAKPTIPNIAAGSQPQYVDSLISCTNGLATNKV